MLEPDLKARIEAALEHYERPRAACIEVLQMVQERRRWISDQDLADVAEVLGMTVHELDDVATFYNLIFRRPVGERVILLCDSVSCWIMGAYTIGRHLRDRLGIGFGGTTADDRFTLLPIACLGACDRAPVMIVGDQTHTHLTAERVDAVLEQPHGEAGDS